MIKIFFLHPLDKHRLSLRRYSNSDVACVTGRARYHSHMIPIGESTENPVCGDTHPHDDPRWPTTCVCGYVFASSDPWQLFTERLYRRSDTSEEIVLRNAPVGACWNEAWRTEGLTYPDFGIGEDGRCLTIQTPGGPWSVDERCTNCTLMMDTTHKCWVRTGRPEDGTLHVSKDGYTCDAGSGSIVLGSYHGFCHHGYLVDA